MNICNYIIKKYIKKANMTKYNMFYINKHIIFNIHNHNYLEFCNPF